MVPFSNEYSWSAMICDSDFGVPLIAHLMDIHDEWWYVTVILVSILLLT